MNSPLADKIISFLNDSGFRRNTSLRDGTFDFYVRKSYRHLEGVVYYHVLDLARVENSNPGHGMFKALLEELELRILAETETLAIYVECVHNKRLRSFLVKQGYTVKSANDDFSDLSYFKILRKVNNDANAL